MEKLNIKRTMLIGLAFLSICTFWEFYDNEIPRILKNTFHLGETWTGVIMAFDNVLALFLLPVLGALSDRTVTRFGKRMPYIVCGTAAASVLLMIIAFLSGQPSMLTPFVGVLLVLLVAMGIYRTPAVSLMPDLTPAPLRSQANAIINLMGTVGGIYTLLMLKFLIKKPQDGQLTDYVPICLSVAGLMVLAVFVLFLTIKENQLKEEIGPVQTETETLPAAGQKQVLKPDVRKSMTCLLISVFLWFTAYNAVKTAFSRYVGEVWGLYDGKYADCLMVATVSAVLCYVPIGWLSQRIGRKRMITIGIIAMTVCYGIAAFLGSFQSVLYILFALIGFGWASINVNSYPMVVEMSGEGEIGRFTGLYYTFSMAAQVFTPIASGFLMEHVSYRTLFPYAVIFSAAALWTMSRVRHGDIRPKEAVSE